MNDLFHNPHAYQPIWWANSWHSCLSKANRIGAPNMELSSSFLGLLVQHLVQHLWCLLFCPCQSFPPTGFFSNFFIINPKSLIQSVDAEMHRPTSIPTRTRGLRSLSHLRGCIEVLGKKKRQAVGPENCSGAHMMVVWGGCKDIMIKQTGGIRLYHMLLSFIVL